MTHSALALLTRLRGADRRDRVILLSVLTSGAAKCMGALVQLVAYPIAVHALGIATFSSYVMLSSILAWIDVSRIGIGPALTRSISLAAAGGKREDEATAFGTALWLSMGMAVLLLGAASIAVALGWVRPATLLGVGTLDRDAKAALGVASLLAAVGVVTSVTEGARAGYLEQFTNNLWNGLGTTISLAAMLIVAWWYPTLTGMCLAVYGTVAFAKLSNMLALAGVSRPYLRPSFGHLKRAMAAQLLGSSVAFLALQICSLTISEGSTLIIGWVHGAGAATPFNVLLRLESLLATGITMITTPLWPAVTDAVLRNDLGWIKRAERRLVVLTLLYSGGAGLAIALFGRQIVHLWLGPQIEIPFGLQLAMGAFYPLWMVVHAYYTLLIGLGRLWLTAAAMALWAAAALVLGLMLVPHLQATGMGLALALGTAAVAWLFPWLTHRAMARGDGA